MRQRRRARMAAAHAEPYTARDLHNRLEDLDYRCSYCACPLVEEFHWDHVIPLSLGGPDAIWNLVPACAPCNLSKGPKPLEEWLPAHLERLWGPDPWEDRSRGRTPESKRAWATTEAGRASGRQRSARRRARLQGEA